MGVSVRIHQSRAKAHDFQEAPLRTRTSADIRAKQKAKAKRRARRKAR
jgi:hypothetical protein